MSVGLGFFQRHADRFNPLAAGMRECQVGAFCAVRAHFSVSREPCVISLPTGAGKTGLMMALAFGLRSRRVLVISPAEVLRLQTVEKFEHLDDLREAGAIPGLAGGVNPAVHSIETELRTRNAWKQLERYDVVTATTRTTSPGMPKIAKPPVDLFDIVFIDEAHHAAAATWMALIKAFDARRTAIVLLTGTPYRRDHKSIGPAPRFVYPISRAIDDGIYAPVSLISAGRLAPERRDRALAHLGVRELRRLQRGRKTKPLLLVKTDRTKHANELGSLYAEAGASLGVVHSEQPTDANKRAITDARAGRSDGLIVVGMLGEGLDIPPLKVAVFHRNPQSLPYTLQIIGRLARSRGELPNGRVVACTDDFSEETFNLFEGSRDWLELIPELERMLIDKLAPRHRETVSETGAEIQLADVSAHFSFTVYHVSKPPLGRSLQGDEFKFQRGWVRVVLDHSVAPGLRVIGTRTEELPRWLRSHGSSDVSDVRYHLHVFYLGRGGVVVQQSTEEAMADLIRDKLVERGQVIPPGKLNHVMAQVQGDYVTLGLKNGVAISGFQASYKTLMGRRVDGAITSLDRRNCHAGHCVARVDHGADAEFRGVAYKHSRIWTLERKNLQALGNWMKFLADAVARRGSATLPRLDMLRQPEPLREFPGKPVAVLPPIDLLDKALRFTRDGDADLAVFPRLDPAGHAKQRLTLACPELAANFQVEIDGDQLAFTEIGSSGWKVNVQSAPQSSRWYTLEQFMAEYPPILVFDDGSNWCDGIYTRPHTTPVLDPASLEVIPWGNCAITVELPAVPPDGRSVHEFIGDRFPNQGTLVVKDHASGEVADFVAFDQTNSRITLYHCKGAATKHPGVDQENVREVVAQGMTSCRWIQSRDLVQQLCNRLANLPTTVMAKGTPVELQTLSQTFDPQSWSYTVVLVQPGLSSAKLGGAQGARARAVLACAEDYVRASGGRLRIMCS